MRCDSMDPQRAGYGFEEDLADLVELNGYKVNKTMRSSDGGVDIIATKTDEVGHEISYVIRCKTLSNPVGRAEIDEILEVKKRFPGSIAVLASASSGFTKEACEMAEKFGIRLWGEAEIGNLQRNIRQKRGQAQKKDGEGEKGQYPIRGGIRPKKKRFKRKFIVFFAILAIFLAYIIHTGPDPVRDFLDLDEKQDQFRQSWSSVQSHWGPVQSDLLDIYKKGHNRAEEQIKSIMEGETDGMNTSKLRELQI